MLQLDGEAPVPREQVPAAGTAIGGAIAVASGKQRRKLALQKIHPVGEQNKSAGIGPHIVYLFQ